MRRKKFYVRTKFLNEETGMTEYNNVADEYRLNVFPERNLRTMEVYGEKKADTLICSARNKLVSKIKDGDCVYINTLPDDEVSVGENADYIVESVMVGNEFTALRFEKQQKEV